LGGLVEDLPVPTKAIVKFSIHYVRYNYQIVTPSCSSFDFAIIFTYFSGYELNEQKLSEITNRHSSSAICKNYIENNDVLRLNNIRFLQIRIDRL